jgi:FkbM family methyltransferase
MGYYHFLKKIINKLINKFKKKRNLLNYIKKQNINKFNKCSAASRSQLGQDLFVLDKLNFASKGFFVEFGVCDGIMLSNTFMLEKVFNWSGIVCEPSNTYQDALKRNRHCHIESKCVFSESGKNLHFTETKLGELSFLNDYRPNDQFLSNNEYTMERMNGKTYKVKTISLNDLLKKYNCPRIFDYLSIDTEGTEYEIIKNLNFDMFSPKIITIEHNYNEVERSKIYNLLTKHNYSRVLEEVSCWDDWYVKKDLIN